MDFDQVVHEACLHRESSLLASLLLLNHAADACLRRIGDVDGIICFRTIIPFRESSDIAKAVPLRLGIPSIPSHCGEPSAAPLASKYPG
jgi:hypothetical protein